MVRRMLLPLVIVQYHAVPLVQHDCFDPRSVFEKFIHCSYRLAAMLGTI
jgi:hypothetical protein